MHKEAGRGKARNNGFEGIDQHATNSYLNKAGKEDRSLLKVILSGSLWTKNKLLHTGTIHEDTCSFCETGARQDGDHLLWECVAFDECRKKQAPRVAQLPLHAVPKSLRIGIAPALKADPNRSYWGYKGRPPL